MKLFAIYNSIFIILWLRVQFCTLFLFLFMCLRCFYNVKHIFLYFIFSVCVSILLFYLGFWWNTPCFSCRRNKRRNEHKRRSRYSNYKNTFFYRSTANGRKDKLRKIAFSIDISLLKPMSSSSIPEHFCFWNYFKYCIVVRSRACWIVGFHG